MQLPGGRLFHQMFLPVFCRGVGRLSSRLLESLLSREGSGLLGFCSLFQTSILFFSAFSIPSIVNFLGLFASSVIVSTAGSFAWTVSMPSSNLCFTTTVLDCGSTFSIFVTLEIMGYVEPDGKAWWDLAGFAVDSDLSCQDQVEWVISLTIVADALHSVYEVASVSAPAISLSETIIALSTPIASASRRPSCACRGPIATAVIVAPSRSLSA